MNRLCLAIVSLLVPAPMPVAAAPVPVARDAESTRFLDAAKDVTASIQKDFWLPDKGLYAREPGGGEVEFMWGNGVMFSALVAAARHQPRTYRPVMAKFFAGLNRYWDDKAPIPGYEPAPTAGNGHDKYYDDNAWMVLTFLEAYELTHQRRYLSRAKHTLDFVLSGWDDTLGGGIWWHQQHKGHGKNTCANAPAAVGCLGMARFGDRRDYIERAKEIVAWTTEHLQDPGDGLFYDSIRADNGHINTDKLTYNTALMLRANLGLYRATGERAYLDEAKRIGSHCDWFLSDEAGAYRDPPKWAHLLVEADLELYRATGDRDAWNRAVRNGDVMYARWKRGPARDFIEQASVARTLWLLADHHTDAGKTFWAQSDAPADR